MKIISLLLCLLGAFSLCSCETVPDQYGVPKQVLSPAGAAIANALVATAVGTGTGALMGNQPGWANGAVSGLSGNVASQLINGFLPQNRGGYQNQSSQPSQDYQYVGVDYPRNSGYQERYQQDQGYQEYQGYQGYSNRAPQPNNREPIYQRLPNGNFVQVN